MTKDKCFIECLASGIACYKAWLLHAFSIKTDEVFSFTCDEGGIEGDGKEIILTLGEKTVKATWWKKGGPVFDYKEEIEVDKNEIPNVTEKVKTKYGRILLNQLILVENSKDKIPFKDGNWFKDNIIGDILNRAATDDNITASEAHAIVNATQFITGLTQLCVPSASEKALATDPAIKKRRKELIEKHKHEINDPSVITKIEKELIAMDRKWLEDDYSYGFYSRTGKSFNINRKKMHVLYGGEADFSDPTKMTFLGNSLREGWELDKTPLYVNSIRGGTYSRGSATALGGEKVKKFQQVFQNCRISEKDCGTKKAAEFYITQYNYKDFLDRQTWKGNKWVELDEATLKAAIGKRLPIRSALYCKTKKTDFCELCAGKTARSNPGAIMMLTATIGSTFMLVSMSAMHGKELATTFYDFNEALH